MLAVKLCFNKVLQILTKSVCNQRLTHIVIMKLLFSFRTESSCPRFGRKMVVKMTSAVLSCLLCCNAALCVFVTVTCAADDDTAADSSTGGGRCDHGSSTKETVALLNIKSNKKKKTRGNDVRFPEHLQYCIFSIKRDDNYSENYGAFCTLLWKQSCFHHLYRSRKVMAQMHGGTHFHSICTVSIPFGAKMVLATLLRRSLASCNLNVLVANFVSDIPIFVLKRDVKLQLTN